MRSAGLMASLVFLFLISAEPTYAAPKKTACRDCPFPITLICVRDPSGFGLRCRHAGARRSNMLVRGLSGLSCFAGGTEPFPLGGGSDTPFPLKCIIER